MYCQNCGQLIKEGEIHHCPALNGNPDPNIGAYSYMPYRDTEPQTPAIAALRQLGGSGQTLAISIMLAVPVLYNFFQKLQAIMEYGKYYSNSFKNREVIKLLINIIPNLLIPLGLFLIWYACKKPVDKYIRPTGFKIIKVYAVINLIIAVIQSLVVIFFILNSFSLIADNPRDLSVLLFLDIILAVFTGLYLKYYMNITASIDSGLDVARGNVYNGNISSFVAFVSILGVIVTIIKILISAMIEATLGSINSFVYVALENAGVSSNIISFLFDRYGLSSDNDTLLLLFNIITLIATILIINMIYKSRDSLSSAKKDSKAPTIVRYAKEHEKKLTVNDNNPYAVKPEIPAPPVRDEKKPDTIDEKETEKVENKSESDSLWIVQTLPGAINNEEPSEKVSVEEVPTQENITPEPYENDKESQLGETEDITTDLTDIFDEATVYLAPVLPAKKKAMLIREKDSTEITIDADTFKLGKSTVNADYTITGNSAVSRVHAIITRDEDKFYIEDNGSLNGTMVNDVPTTEKTELLSGDVITLADEKFSFIIME